MSVSRPAEPIETRVQADSSPSFEKSLKEELWSKFDSICDLQQLFCCSTVLFVISASIAVFIFVHVYLKPVGINVKIQSLKVNNFTLIKRIEEANQNYYAVYIIAYLDFQFLATNPSSKFTVVYSNSSFECLTRSLHLGLLKTGAFRQGPQVSTNWTRVLLLDTPEPVPGPLRAALIQDVSNNVISMQIRGPIAAHFEIAGFFFPTFKDFLNCSVKFKYFDQSMESIVC